MAGDDMAILLAIAAFFGLLGGVIGKAKGNGGAGVALGFLLGPLGVIIVAVMRPSPEIEAERMRAVQAHLGTGSGAWWPDPYGRHEKRYYDGTRWTEHVADDGKVTVEAPVA